MRKCLHLPARGNIGHIGLFSKYIKNDASKERTAKVRSTKECHTLARQ
jgi:hypothetical protein